MQLGTVEQLDSDCHPHAPTYSNNDIVVSPSGSDPVSWLLSTSKSLLTAKPDPTTAYKFELSEIRSVFVEYDTLGTLRMC